MAIVGEFDPFLWSGKRCFSKDLLEMKIQKYHNYPEHSIMGLMWDYMELSSYIP
jgi:hypothetical protein